MNNEWERKLATYPKAKKPRLSAKIRKYRVAYDLAYDGGSSKWDGLYRTLVGARLAIFWNRKVASWGGTAVLYDRGVYRRVA